MAHVLLAKMTLALALTAMAQPSANDPPAATRSDAVTPAGEAQPAKPTPEPGTLLLRNELAARDGSGAVAPRQAAVVSLTHRPCGPLPPPAVRTVLSPQLLAGQERLVALPPGCLELQVELDDAGSPCRAGVRAEVPAGGRATWVVDRCDR